MTNEKEISMPRFRYEVNLNSILSLASIMSMVGGIFFMSGEMRQEINNMKKSLNERYEAIGTEHNKVEARIAVVEYETNRIETLAYRITEQEKHTGNLTILLGDMKERMAEQGSDIRIIRDTVKRLEARDEANK